MHESECESNKCFRYITIQQDEWEELLKALALGGNGGNCSRNPRAPPPLSPKEVVGIIGDMLGRDHFEILEQLCSSSMVDCDVPEIQDDDDDDDEDSEEEDGATLWLPVSELDLTNCKVSTPSYRSVPEEYHESDASGRSDAEREMLNDEWVSVPTGSEDDFAFKNMRKNQYEEVLFRCEDEQYEVDRLIDCNASAVRRLQQLKVSQVNNVKYTITAVFRLNIPCHTLTNTQADIDEIRSSARNSGGRSRGKSRGGGEVYRRFRMRKGQLRAVHLKAIVAVYEGHEKEVMLVVSMPHAKLCVIF